MLIAEALLKLPELKVSIVSSVLVTCNIIRKSKYGLEMIIINDLG